MSQSLSSVVSLRTNGDLSGKKLGAVIRAKAIRFNRRPTCSQDALASRDVSLRLEREVTNAAGLRLQECQFSSVENGDDRRCSDPATLLLQMAATCAICELFNPQNAEASAIAAYSDVS